MDAGEAEIVIEWEARRRKTIVYTPSTASSLPPLLLAFHGSGVNARQMVEFSGLNALADRVGAVVAYPNGEGRVEQARSWNAGNCCGHAHHHGLDDVGYLDCVLDELIDRGVDPARVYATGMSNGAMMCYRLASERAERFAAIAPVAGPMALDQVAPSTPVPICHFHGDRDEFTPFEGGRGARSVSKVEFLSVETTIQAWVKANGCRPQPEITRLPIKVDDGTHVTRRLYASGRAGGEVVLYLVHGAGHVWFGRDLGWTVLGKPTSNIDANKVMWEFFQRFRRSSG